MGYVFCDVIVLSALLCQFSPALLCNNTYNSTIFSQSTQYAVEHTVARATVIVVLFRKLSLLYFFPKKFNTNYTQSLSPRKIIMNSCTIKYYVSSNKCFLI